MSEEKSLNFIEEIVENDLNSGKYENDRIVNSKFPEFGFDKNGLHKNFTKKDLEKEVTTK